MKNNDPQAQNIQVVRVDSDKETVYANYDLKHLQPGSGLKEDGNDDKKEVACVTSPLLVGNILTKRIHSSLVLKIINMQVVFVNEFSFFTRRKSALTHFPLKRLLPAKEVTSKTMIKTFVMMAPVLPTLLPQT